MAIPHGSLDAAVEYETPFFSVPVDHFPWIIDRGLVSLAGTGPEQGGDRFRCLLTGQPGHFNLAAEGLLLRFMASGSSVTDKSRLPAQTSL